MFDMALNTTCLCNVSCYEGLTQQDFTQPVITYSKLIKKTLGQGVKYVQS